MSTVAHRESNVIDAGLIEALESLLSQARSGELEGFAAALLLADNRVGVAIAGAAWDAPTTTIGLLWQAQQELHAYKPVRSMS